MMDSATFSRQFFMSSFKSVSFLFAVVLFLSNTGEFANANQPRLNMILPRGVQRGVEHKLRFYGERIGEAQELLLYDAGITAGKIEMVDANTIDVTVTVAADCRLGEHVVQLRTLRGLSDYRSFFVGVFPQVDEIEPNTSLEAQQPVSINVTLNGTVANEDVDYFVVDAKAGDRLSLECEAVRLGCPLGTLFDPFIAILNAERFEIAVCDDTPLFNQDCFLSILVPADGKYTVMVREASYGGNDNCRYRLHVGNFPRPTAVYPAGGNPGQSIDLTFLNDPSGPIQQKLQLPSEFGFRPGIYLQHESGMTPSAFPFRLNALPNFLELEPNNTWVTEPVFELPQAINGVVQDPGDVDVHLFNAKKDQVWEVECFAKRIGSGLDPVMNIYKASDKSHVVGNDDSRGHDPYLRFQVPEDGQYFLRVTDHLSRGRSDFVYRVEMSPIATGLTLNIPRVDRYSQLLQSIAIPAGNRFATQIVANRENFGGEIKILEAALPPGVKMTAPTMLANLNVVPVLFEADAAAVPAGGLIELRGRWNDANQNLEGRFVNLADFANGEPNNTLYYGCSVNRLAMAVTKPAPFKVEIVPPQSPLVRDGTINLKIKITRDEGFIEPVYLQFPFRPPGVGTTYQINTEKGQTEIDYPLNANGAAQLGKWPVYVLAGSTVDGGLNWVSSQMAELEIADPFVRFASQRTACDQGQPAQVICNLEQLTPFEGEATVDLLGLPPNTSTTQMRFTKETTQLVFNVVTNDQCPLGQHKSLFCQLNIPLNGVQVLSVTGQTELQINKPPVVAVAPPAATTTEPPPVAPPTAKPLTRLEKLRQDAKQQGGGSN
jgi:hypothetical protein